MMRAIGLSVVLSVTLSLHAQTVTLSGTVKKTGAATGLSGVKVSLVKLPSLSATTDADGKFSITSTTSIQTQPNRVPSFQFDISGDCILFSPAAGNVAARVDIFSTSGRKIFSTELTPGQESRRSITLPQLSSGINILRITMGTTTLTRAIVRVGNELFTEEGSPTETAAGAISLQKQAAAAAVDTLVASKSGFTTKRVPLDSYTKENIVIEIDSAGGTGGKCTRESLKALVDKYIEAQTAGDPTKMPLASNIKVLENTKNVGVDGSSLKKALKIDFHRSFYDVDSCRTFSEIIVATTKPTTVMGTRLRIVNDEITEIEAIITKEGDWLYNAENYLKYSKQEEDEWYILPEEERPSREFLVDAGNQYLDLFKNDNEDIPWGAPCARLEGGAYTNPGNNSNDNCLYVNSGGSFTIGGRDFIVDVEMGTVDVFCKFCTLDSHLFRLVDGHFRFVHTLTIGCNM